MSEDRLCVIVMAGGSSSRLFPYNKVVSDLTGCGRTMIQQAMDRAAGDEGLVPAERFFVVTGEGLAPTIGAQLDALPPDNLLVEPERRNTLPAILWAAAHIRARVPGATIAVLTADHVIPDFDGFRATVRDAAGVAEERDAIVTIGIPPSDDAREWTGFGAVRVGAADDGVRGDLAVLSFDEKPSRARATELMQEGGAYWNSGMFLFTAATLERALEVHQAAMARVYRRLCEAVGGGGDARAAFAALPRDVADATDGERRVDNTMDYAIMVPLTRDADGTVAARLVPARFSWVDIGSWDATRKVVGVDARGNVLIGRVEARGCDRCVLVAAPGESLTAEGLDRLIVVADRDWSVVVPEARAQDVKNLFAAAQAAGDDPADVLMECERCVTSAASGRIAALGVSDAEIVRDASGTRVRPLRHARLATFRAALLGGESLRESEYAEQAGVDRAAARADIDWLIDIDRETDGAGFHGIEASPECDRDDRQLRRVIVDKTMLGAYDIRGNVARCFTDKVAFVIGLAVAAFLEERRVDGALNVTASHNPASDDGIKWAIRAQRGSRPVALVGRSIRNTSPRIQQLLMEGLRAGGIEVRDLGATATPEVYHALACFGEGSGSRFEYDSPLGANRFVRSLDGAEVAALCAGLPTADNAAALDRLQAGRADVAAPARHVDTSYWRYHNTWIAACVRLGADVAQSLFDHWVQERDDFCRLIEILSSIEWPETVDESFWRTLCERLEVPDSFASSPLSAIARPFAGRTIGTDFANGSNWRKAEVLTELGFDVIPVVAELDGHTIDSSKPDGTFPLHHPDPTKPEYQRLAIELAIERDIPVVLFDEDGDRFTVVDELGRVVHSADLAVLLAPAFDGPILVDVRYPRYAIDALEASGRQLDRTLLRGPVGYAYYVEAALAIQGTRDAGGRVDPAAAADELVLYPQSARPLTVRREDLTDPVAFGIEPSGHAFFRANGYANDASYFMGVVLGLLGPGEKRGRRLAELSDSVQRNPASPPELRVRMEPDISVSERRRFVAVVLERIVAEAEKRGLALALDPMDGGLLEIRNAAGDVVSQALVRNSNNESVFGLAFEGRTHADKHAIEDLVVEVLAATEIEVDGRSVRADFDSQRTSQYFREPTPENREDERDHPAVLERLGRVREPRHST